MSPNENDLSFVGHLEVLRWHIIRSVIAVVVFAVVAFIAKDIVFGKVIMGPSKKEFVTYQVLCDLADKLNTESLCFEIDFKKQNRKVTGQFTTHIIVSITVGFILAFPYIFWEIWRFIKPALYDNEEKSIKGTVFWVTLLFGMGISFGYFVVSPLTVNFMINYTVDPTIENIIDISSYISVITGLIIVCGLMFQLPIACYFLSKAGLLYPQPMRNHRKHAVVVTLFVSALFTPPEPFSQICVAVPLLLLYEISIKISAVVARKREKELLAG